MFDSLPFLAIITAKLKEFFGNIKVHSYTFGALFTGVINQLAASP